MPGDTLVVNEIAFMSDSELNNIKKFPTDGGKVIWVGHNAVYHYNGCKRFKNELKNINSISADHFSSCILTVQDADRWREPSEIIAYHKKECSSIHNDILQFMDREFTGGRSLKVKEAHKGLLFTLFQTEEKAVIHMVNTIGTLPKVSESTKGGFVFESQTDHNYKVRYWSEKSTAAKWVYPLNLERCKSDGIESLAWPAETTTLDTGDVIEHQTSKCIDHFIECIKSNVRSPLSFVSSAMVTTLRWAAQRSAQTGKEIRLSDL